MKDTIKKLLREALEEVKYYVGVSKDDSEILHRTQTPDFSMYKTARFKGFSVTPSLSLATQEASKHNGQVLSIMLKRDSIIDINHITNRELKTTFPNIDDDVLNNDVYKDTLILKYAVKNRYGAIKLKHGEVIIINPSAVIGIHKAL